MTLPTPLARGRRLMGDVAVFAFPLVAGSMAASVSIRNIPVWYRTLEKPSWNPPDAVFGPVWSTLYLLMGTAAVVIRHAEASPATIRRAEAVNALQVTLNAAWTLAFFGAKDIRAGLVLSVALWVAIAATVAAYARIDRRAALLMLPYLAWTTVAVGLNLAVWRLNES